MSIKNKIGVPVTGEDFFGRVQELSRANRYLDEGQSLLLSAPRREMLEHDGYLIRTEGNRKFRSPLLQNWWKYKFID